ncbi:hypothetical protein H7U19_05630 [Hyunsoonleella sp. SJ7]|uniref:Uncharacterized protein n=1 Tax=Hyunsoonleella aquatilis TaxID=2762758 RepID=A0A923H7B9_9FLAO|nr:hypothetical protein [Hyunsoonleella aquatilis]MBC3757876.1 hypothetical protein [Hyunsoonleella aquatilis]
MKRFIKNTAIIATIAIVILTSKGISERIKAYYSHCISVMAGHTVGSARILIA